MHKEELFVILTHMRFQAILTYIKESKRELLMYVFVGGSGVFLDIGLLFLFKEYLFLSPVSAVLISQPLVLLYNFTLNKYWSFQNTAMPHWQMFRYGILVAWNYSFSAGMMYIFEERLGFQYMLVRLASIAIMVSWNFLLYKHWVYRK